MEEGKRHVRLGLFVVVTLFVLVAVLFLLGGRKLFQPTFTFETYFNESVAGLELGAPVRFRGVPLGQVSEILTSAATYERNVPIDKRRDYILVRAKVNLSAEEAEQMGRDVVQLVRRGLRAQTQLAGITGQQYLALDFLDVAKFPPLEFQWTPKYTYVPSAPSRAGEIIANAQAFLEDLKGADIKTLGQNLNALVVDVHRKVNEAPIDHALRKIDSAATRLDGLLANPGLGQSVDNVAAISRRLRKLVDNGDLDRMVNSMGNAADRLDALIGDNQYDVKLIIQDLRVTANNLRVLSETIKRYPAGALLGGPPEKVQLPGSSR